MAYHSRLGVSSLSGDSKNAHHSPANLKCKTMKTGPNKRKTGVRTGQKFYISSDGSLTPLAAAGLSFLEDAQLGTDQIDQNANSA
jgi:hypothetical protein